MMLAAMLILYTGAGWAFPWWMWVLSVLFFDRRLPETVIARVRRA